MAWHVCSRNCNKEWAMHGCRITTSCDLDLCLGSMASLVTDWAVKSEQDRRQRSIAVGEALWRAARLVGVATAIAVDYKKLQWTLGNTPQKVPKKKRILEWHAVAFSLTSRESSTEFATKGSSVPKSLRKFPHTRLPHVYPSVHEFVLIFFVFLWLNSTVLPMVCFMYVYMYACMCVYVCMILCSMYMYDHILKHPWMMRTQDECVYIKKKISECDVHFSVSQ